MSATLCLLAAAVLAFLHGAGIQTWTIGSVTLHTIGFALFFFIAAALVSQPWPFRKS